MRRPRLFIAAVLASIALSIAAQTNDPKPNAQWQVTQKILNDTPYTLRRLSMMLTENTAWRTQPAPSIPSGKTDEHVFYNNMPGHGLVGLVTYGAYDEKESLMGVVIAISAVDCDQPTPAGCLSYHRWEAPVCDSNANVRGRWWDDGGSPSDFRTTIQFLVNKSEGCKGEGLMSEGSAKQPNIDWVVNAATLNRSQFTLKRRFVWNSESTYFARFPPQKIDREQVSPTWIYANGTLLHGPAALIMYDVFDGSRWIGSTVLEASVDCAGYTPAGCTSAYPWQRAVAEAIPGYSLKAVAGGSGPPTDYRVGFELVGQKKP